MAKRKRPDSMVLPVDSTIEQLIPRLFKQPGFPNITEGFIKSDSPHGICNYGINYCEYKSFCNNNTAIVCPLRTTLVGKR